MKYYVESNNGYGPFGVIKVCDTHDEALCYAEEYSKAYGVRTKVTTGNYERKEN